MKEQLMKIEELFTALKADVMIEDLGLEEREGRLIELGEQEAQAKKEINQQYEELKGILSDAKDWARILKVKPNVALLLLSYRELKQIHWHLDQMVESK